MISGRPANHEYGCNEKNASKFTFFGWEEDSTTRDYLLLSSRWPILNIVTNEGVHQATVVKDLRFEGFRKCNTIRIGSSSSASKRASSTRPQRKAYESEG
jgi:hypothetical protein